MAANSIQLYAAGSLKAALTDIAAAFESATGAGVATHFGPSGLLAADIASGAPGDVFASANMRYPQALHDAGASGRVRHFAHNELCALVRPGLDVTTENLLDHMLDPEVRLGTSTPRADPSGDYAFESFGKAETVRPGARAALENKALRLVGAEDSAASPAGKIVYGWHIDEGRADIFLTYRTNALAARTQYPAQQIVELPEVLAVGADYGLTVMNGAPPEAQQLADFILSADGQKILAAFGFAPVT